jgi:sec-independent protein translocase protein TatB
VFNIGLGEIVVIVLVTLMLFGPERLPEMARQVGRFLGRLRLSTQDALDQLKDEADLKDMKLPELRIGSLRSQARDYVRELMDVEGQMAELEREREQLKAALNAERDGDARDGSGEPGKGDPVDQGTADAGPPPVDPEAT